MRFFKSEWAGNHWSSIDIEPYDWDFSLPFLEYLAATYDYPLPKLAKLVYMDVADFEILGSKASMHVDVFTFSIAFELTSVRDRVYDDLCSLPPDQFADWE